jgi:O-antigen/teichoic acid export membrane protein
MVANLLIRFHLSPLIQRLVKASFWSMVADALSKGLLMAAMIFLARILDKDGFGEFGTVRSTVNLFATFGGMGLGLTANKYLSRSKVVNKHQAGAIIGSSYILACVFGLIVSLSLYLSSSYIAVFFLDAPELTICLEFASALVFLSSVSGAQIGILQGFEAFSRLAICSLLHGTLIFIGITVGAYFYSVLGALIGYVSSGVLAVVIFHFHVISEAKNQEISLVYKNISSILPILWKFSVPVLLTGVVVAPFKWFPETLIAKQDGFESLGVFQASFLVPTIIITAVSSINAPIIALIAGVRQEITLRLQYLNLYASWYGFLFLAFPLIYLSDYVPLIFGDQYAGGLFAELYVILVCYAGLLLYFQGVVRVFVQSNNMWFVFSTNLVEGVSLLIAFCFVFEGGVLGLAKSYLFSYLIRIAVSLPVLKKNIAVELLCDRYFVMSTVIFFIFVCYKLTHLV